MYRGLTSRMDTEGCSRALTGDRQVERFPGCAPVGRTEQTRKPIGRGDGEVDIAGIADRNSHVGQIETKHAVNRRIAHLCPSGARVDRTEDATITWMREQTRRIARIAGEIE